MPPWIWSLHPHDLSQADDEKHSFVEAFYFVLRSNRLEKKCLIARKSRSAITCILLSANKSCKVTRKKIFLNDYYIYDGFTNTLKASNNSSILKMVTSLSCLGHISKLQGAKHQHAHLSIWPTVNGLSSKRCNERTYTMSTQHTWLLLLICKPYFRFFAPVL